MKSVTYGQFCDDEMLHSAVERKLEVFGEAAGHVSQQMQDAHPEIPWKDIKGVRVILAHKYADIELGVVWEAASNELPDLLPKIEELMKPFENEEPQS